MADPTIGKEFLFLVDLNTSATQAGERWAKVSAQKEGGFSRNNDFVDTTTKDDSGFASDVITVKRWTLNFSGNININNPALDLIERKQASIQDTDYKLKIKLVDQKSGVELVGFIRLESFEVSFGTTEVTEFSLSGNGQGSYELR